MPPKTRKRKASGTDGNTTEEVAPRKATQAPKKATTGTARQRKGKNAASEIDEGARVSSNTVGTSKRRKMLASDAKKEIKIQGNNIIKFIDSEMKARPPPFEKAVFNKDLSSDLESTLPWTSSSSALKKGGPKTFPRLLLKSLDELQQHIDTYEALTKQDSGIKAPTWMHWEQDVKDLSELSQHGLNMASKIVNHAIMPDLHALPTKPAEGANDIEKIAWESVENSVPKRSEETWGKAAQSQVKAFTGVLELLPAEE
ncbi:hypothetical protein FZEAL_8324 [Fusarium zealandicum]|uniref:Uncharacterized protein n=1 Tax=Fusarium zealandicum TaxID=1053134 RepID=A0A8H4UDZ8_9HYPO|nr:hypothetical protein FZEAL_8324 [Fusarium zealandicum]